MGERKVQSSKGTAKVWTQDSENIFSLHNNYKSLFTSCFNNGGLLD
ncbi:MAG: hypothetical protein HRU09_19995 [Oligoflexales bacterium]|nr:hypothetical protein [Oligoflexales bacterium]